MLAGSSEVSLILPEGYRAGNLAVAQAGLKLPSSVILCFRLPDSTVHESPRLTVWAYRTLLRTDSTSMFPKLHRNSLPHTRTVTHI